VAKWGGSVFLPAAGNPYGTDISNVGTDGYYWVGNLVERFANYAYGLYFNSGYHNLHVDGFSVRPVAE
jgi:hypothetical protein